MKTFTFLLFFLIFLSCESDDYDTTIIGHKNKNFDIIKLDPGLSVLPSNKDSLDINFDGNFDIVFIKSPKPAIYGYGSETNILVKKGLQIALSNVNNYPDTLRIKTILDDNLVWSAKESSNLVLQSFNCGGYDGCVGFANFLNVSNKYIGFKNGQKFGWIKVDNTEWELKIKEYTVLK